MFDIEQAREIMRLSRQGLTQVQIAEAMGISRGLVSRTMLRVRGHKKNKRSNVDEHTAAIWQGLADAGATQTQIGKQSGGYAQCTVSHQLKQRKERA